MSMKSKLAVVVASVVAAPAAFATGGEASSNPVIDAINGALGGLDVILATVGTVAAVGMAVAIAFKVYGKSRQAVNKV